MWAVIGGQLGFVQFPGNDSEPARSGPGIAQQLHNTYEQYLRHFENAYILTVKNRTATGSPQQPIQQMNSGSPAIGNNPTPVMSGNPTEMPPNPPRPFFNQQLIATAARYALISAQDMRAQRVHEHMIAFVERHRPELMKVYQQQVQLIAAKRNAEQEQQNIAQGQLPNMHEQASIGLQPGAQRTPQVIAANMASVPSGDSKMVNGSFVPENITAAVHKQSPTPDQIQHAMMTIGQLKQVFQQRSELSSYLLCCHLSSFPGLHGMPALQILDEQRLEYNQLLEQVYKMTSELEVKLHMYFVVFKNEELLRKYVAIVSFFVSLSSSSLPSVTRSFR